MQRPVSLIALSVVLVASSVAFAGNGFWTTHGPYAKSVYTVALDPSNPTTLYAGTFGSGVYKSTDAALSWTGSRAGLTNTYVRSLAIDPSHLQMVFCGTNDGVFRSTDGGVTWALALSTLNSVRAISMCDSTSLYSGTYGQGVYKSTDGGQGWVHLRVFDPSSFDSLNHIRSLACVGRDTVYAGGSISDIGPTGGAIFKSVDGGTNWVQLQPGLAIRSSVMSIAIGPLDHNYVIVGTAALGVYRSTNAGATWTQVNGTLSAHPLPDLRVNAVAVNRDTLRYAGTDSTGGLYYRTYHDSLVGWLAGSGLPGPSAVVKSIGVNPVQANIVYVGTDGLGVFKSSDYGATWVQMSQGLLNTTGRSLAVDPVQSDVVYDGTGFGDGIWKSTDSGLSWVRAAAVPTSNSILDLTIDPMNRSTLYAAAYGTGVLKSTDAGVSWVLSDTVTLTNRYVRTLAADSATGGAVYCGTGNGIFKSTTGGNSWFASSTGLPPGSSVRSLALDPFAAATIYAGTDTIYLYKSTDAGANWFWSSNGIAVADSFIRTIAVDPAYSGVVYVGSDSGHVYKSTDGAGSWTLLYSLPTGSVRDIVVDPVNPSILYVGTWGAGVFRCAASGGTYEAINDSLVDLNTYSLVAGGSGSYSTLQTGTDVNGEFSSTVSNVGIQDPGNHKQGSGGNVRGLQSSPNPFSRETTISFQISTPSARVSLKVYDLTGRLVRTIWNSPLSAGTHHEVWDGRGNDQKRAAAGIYFVRLEEGTKPQTHRVILMP